MMSLRTSPTRLARASALFNPTFRVADWQAVDPLMAEMAEMTDALAGWDSFGWSRSGDRLMWRSAFDDTDAMLVNIAAVQRTMDRMLAGPATLDRLQFVSPAAELARLQDETKAMAAAVSAQPLDYFQDVDDIAYSYFRKEIPSGSARQGAAGESKQPNTLCTMTPHYSIKNWATAKPIMEAIINQANNEPGCTYFGWAKAGDKLHSRESFVDGNALKRHLEGVRPLMDSLRAGTAATFDRLEIDGPALEVGKVKDLVADLSPEYFKQIESSAWSAESIEGSAAAST